jgi:hypothetical protein
VEPRNLLKLNDIHIIPLTGIRLWPWQSPKGAVESGALLGLSRYYEVVVPLDSDLSLQQFPEIQLSRVSRSDWK